MKTFTKTQMVKKIANKLNKENPEFVYSVANIVFPETLFVFNAETKKYEIVKDNDILKHLEYKTYRCCENCNWYANSCYLNSETCCHPKNNGSKYFCEEYEHFEEKKRSRKERK